MKPFLLLRARPAGPIAADEFAAIHRYGRLGAGELVDRDLAQPGADDIDLDDYAGFIISGSPYSLLAAKEAKTSDQIRVETHVLRLAERILEADKPTLGICFGLQVLAVACGATLTRDLWERISAPDITLTAEGRADPLLGTLPARFKNYVGHSDAIDRQPEQMTVLGYSDLVPVQLARFTPNVYGTQYHPEIGHVGIAMRIANYDGVYFQADERDAVLRECLAAYTEHRIVSAFTAAHRQS